MARFTFVTKLSKLTIDVHKDWSAYRITNIGAPTLDTHVPRARAEDILSGRFPMTRMPDGALGQYIRGSGAGLDPAYAVVKLSELSIDVAKDWGGYKIANLGAPTVAKDAFRYGDVITDAMHGTRGSGLHTDSHARLHDHSLAEDGSPIALAGVPTLPRTKLESPIVMTDMVLEKVSADPTLREARIWFRTDLDLPSYSPEGTTVRRIPFGTINVDAHASRHIDGGADEITSKLDFRAMNLLLAGATATTTFSTTSTSPVDVTGLACSITLPVTASVLVFCSVFEYYNNTVNKANYQRIMRGTTSLRLTSTGVYNTAYERYDSLTQCHDWQVASGTYTYKLQGYVSGGTGYWGMASLPSHGVINAIALVW